MTRNEILAIAKPILFNTEMVRAILDGRKTVTRRVIKPQPILKGRIWYLDGARCSDTSTNITPVTRYRLYRRMPYKPGGFLYVRETWCKNYPHQYGRYFYRADGEEIQMPLITGGTAPHGKADGLKWRPSIHMPKEAARLFLRVVEVRAERLQEITNDGAHAEGVLSGSKDPQRYKKSAAYQMLADNLDKVRFSDLWNSTIKPTDLPMYGWEANPWVWVIDFERVEANQNG